jgi:hypothetical protein
MIADPHVTAPLMRLYMEEFPERDVEKEDSGAHRIKRTVTSFFLEKGAGFMTTCM